MRTVIASRRNPWVLGLVVLAHGAVLWGLMQGAARHALPTPMPVTVFLEAIAPPAPPLPRQPPQAAQPEAKAPRVTEPLPVPRVAETANLPVAPAAPTATADAPAPAAPVAAAPSPTPVAPPMAPRIELPSSDADYLQNPKPAYPPLSKRMGEQGQVLVRVSIGADGTLLEASIARSSGSTRLDEAALAAVRKWRFVPGRRNGVAVAMDHQVPINFVLE